MAEIAGIRHGGNSSGKQVIAVKLDEIEGPEKDVAGYSDDQKVSKSVLYS
jgi:hypothetical protein